MLTNEQVEEIQGEAGELEGPLEEAIGHLSCAVSCETEADLRANLGSLRRELRGILVEVESLYEKAGGKLARLRPARKPE